MPYSFRLHAPDLLWVVGHGHLELDQAELYFQEVWRTLDGCPCPTDLLVDGRAIRSATGAARRRTEQVLRHPHLGHIAFVVSEYYVLLFAPLVRLVSGIGIFGDEHEALDFLRSARGLPPVIDLGLAEPVTVPASLRYAARPVAPAMAYAGSGDGDQSVSAVAPEVGAGPAPRSTPVYELRTPRFTRPQMPNLSFAGTLHRLTDTVNNLSRNIEGLVEAMDEARLWR